MIYWCDNCKDWVECGIHISVGRGYYIQHIFCHKVGCNWDEIKIKNVNLFEEFKSYNKTFSKLQALTKRLYLS